MKEFLKFLINLTKSILIKNRNRRYCRISPSHKGKIWFYDKDGRGFFGVNARDRIDSITADQVFTNNDYDLRFLKRYDELIRQYNSICAQNKKPLIIDCGANIGFSAIHFATTFPQSMVISIEPEKNNFSLMKKNCAGLNNVELLNKAVGNFDGYVSINDSDADNNAFRTSRNENGEGDIEVISINSILQVIASSEAVPFIVKIDIEGFEDDLFSNNTEWVEKFPLLIIETHDWMLPKQANSHNFLKVISKQRRDFIHRGENIYSISNN